MTARMKRIGLLLLAAYGALGIFSGFEDALAENHWRPMAVAWVVMGVLDNHEQVSGCNEPESSSDMDNEQEEARSQLTQFVALSNQERVQ
jgi:hypothetical protein